MVRAIPVVLYFVISILITIRMTVFYCRNSKDVPIAYPSAILALFTVLIILNSFPVPTFMGDSFTAFWQEVTNGGYILDPDYGIFSVFGLIILTIKLYCTANVAVGLFYVIIEKIVKHKTEVVEPSKEQLKAEAISERKTKIVNVDKLPKVGEDFSFITDIMPVNGIMNVDGIRIEIINNSGKKIPEGKKRIFAKRILDHQQLDSKTEEAQPEGDIPYIEIWAVESLV